MQITSGLFDHGLLQRDARSRSDAPLTGTAQARGKVMAKVMQGRKLVLNPTVIGSANQGQFSARLKGIPAGGPYDVQLSIVDGQGKTLETLSVRDVVVGDLWIAAGQSNMEGIGLTKHAAKPHPLVRAFQMDDVWEVAQDPIHQLAIAVDPVHNKGVRQPRPKVRPRVGTGPAVHFAQDMLRRTGVPQGILACAHGGTSLLQWDPALISKKGESLFGATVRRLGRNGGRVAGVIWYQGEAETWQGGVEQFTQRMKTLVAAFRRVTGDRQLPFVQVQLSRLTRAADPVHWESIRQQQFGLSNHVKGVATVPALDLELDDIIHVAGECMGRLGRRMAEAMDVLIRGKKAAKPGNEQIKPIRASISDNAEYNAKALIIEFANVAGKLQSIGRPMGFTVFAAGIPTDYFRAELKDNTIVLYLDPGSPGLDSVRVSYGCGVNPQCNITDAKHRSLPAFYQMPVGRPRAMSKYARNAKVSAVLPLTGNMDALELPGDLSSLSLESVKFATDFMDMHLKIGPTTPEPCVLWYVVDVEVPEPMMLSLMLGYDGPVKTWIDGKAVHTDLNGKNPAVPDAHGVRWQASAGRHQLVIALSTNQGRAWGVFVRFERHGLTKKQIETPTYTLPTFVE